MLTNKIYECICFDCGLPVTCYGSVGDCPKCNGMLKMLARYGVCCCGDAVEFSRFTNTCECGRDYNGNGQGLAPREFWGEECNESVQDILMADIDPFGED